MVILPFQLFFALSLSSSAIGFQSNRQRPFAVPLARNRSASDPFTRDGVAVPLFARAMDVPPPSVPSKAATMAISGKLFSTMSKLVIGPEKARAIFSAITQATHPGDVLMIAFLGWMLIPLCNLVNKRRFEENSERFTTSKIHRCCALVSEVAKIAAIVWLSDMVALTLKTVGFTFPYQVNLSTAVAKITFLVWFAAKLSALKTQFILRKFRVTTLDKLGKGNIYDRVGNLFICVTTGLIISDVLALETGRAFSSIFALGSVGTLVFSLASKDIASQFIGGLALSASNKFYEGEEIKLGDSTVGIVSRVGWMNTEIRGFDEIIMKIPNSQLANQRVSNVSRMRKSQVKQFLWIGYNDIYKIPQFIEDVKKEIKASCPLLIDDGTRPFWVHWREYASDHLEIVVDTHHNIKPSSMEYYNNRQAVLLAIARAAKKNRVEFAVPHLQLKTNNASIESALSGESLDRPNSTLHSDATGMEYQSEEIDHRP